MNRRLFLTTAAAAGVASLVKVPALAQTSEPSSPLSAEQRAILAEYAMLTHPAVVMEWLKHNIRPHESVSFTRQFADSALGGPIVYLCPYSGVLSGWFDDNLKLPPGLPAPGQLSADDRITLGRNVTRNDRYPDEQPMWVFGGLYAAVTYVLPDGVVFRSQLGLHEESAVDASMAARFPATITPTKMLTLYGSAVDRYLEEQRVPWYGASPVTSSIFSKSL